MQHSTEAIVETQLRPSLVGTDAIGIPETHTFVAAIIYSGLGSARATGIGLHHLLTG